MVLRSDQVCFAELDPEIQFFVVWFLVFCFLETGSLTVAQVVFKLTKIQVLLPSASLVLGL